MYVLLDKKYILLSIFFITQIILLTLEKKLTKTDFLQIWIHLILMKQKTKENILPLEFQSQIQMSFSIYMNQYMNN